MMKNPNNIQYSTSTGTYYITHDTKVSFFMTEFYGRNIIKHSFYFDNKERDTGIYYDMIIFQSLMLKIGIIAEYKRDQLEYY